MPNPLIHRALLCAIALTLAACNSSTPPSAANAPTVAPSPVVAVPAPPASVAPATPASISGPAPEIVQLDLLDIGVATAADTLDSLKQRYGASNIKVGDVPGAEGEELPGWMLYPDDPKRRIYIYLDDAGKHPSLLRVLDGESTWSRSDGIHMGLTLTELVKLNGKPIQFSGFGWDYGGTVSDWHHGNIEKKGISGGLTLCPPDFPGDKYPQDYPSGEADFSSDNAAVVRDPPVICEFGASLDNAAKQP